MKEYLGGDLYAQTTIGQAVILTVEPENTIGPTMALELSSAQLTELVKLLRRESDPFREARERHERGGDA